MTMFDQLSAFEMAKKIKAGELKSIDVVNHFSDVIQKQNKKLNAVVETRFDQAREEAKAADFQIQKGSKNLGPLHGVPFTLKEMIATEGMRSTSGSVHKRANISNYDASLVARMKKAGAILIGTTNVPEVGFWFECDNPVYGSTKNPYNTSRTSGGSSGGEGAIIAAGGSPMGIGSDIGGSIRIPAFFCGIFGHKPSDKVVPMTGHYPINRETAHEMTGTKYPFTVMGPMARKASDLYEMMKLFIGPDEYDVETRKDYVLQPKVTDWSKIKIFTLPRPVIHGTTQTEDDLAQSVINAGRYFEQLGAEVIELPARIMLKGFDAWTGRAWSLDARDFETYLSNGEQIKFGKEFLKLFTGRRSYTLPSLLTAFVDKYVPGKDGLKEVYWNDLQELKAKLQDKLGKNGILIMPPHPRKAPKLHSTYSRPFDFAFTGVINGLGFPATCAPMGLSENGLPLGVQLVANEDQDHLTLSAAEQIEAGFGGWQPPKQN